MKRLLVSIVFIIASGAAGSAQSITYYFPQVAIGGGWMTTIFISNTMTSSAGAATIVLTKSDGTPFNANWLDEMGNNVTNNNNVIGVQLASGESRKLVSVGDIPLTTGFATINANSSAILANAIFTQFDSSGRNLLAEAGVPMAIPLLKQAIFVDTTNSFKTGVAVANPNTQPLQVHFDLLNDNGQVITSTVQNFGPQSQIAVFLDQLFPGMPSMVGRVQFWSTNPMTAVGLRFSPLGIPFTTLSPLAIAN
jgi:hypothetical protein